MILIKALLVCLVFVQGKKGRLNIINDVADSLFVASKRLHEKVATIEFF